jgi:hypothetical protein
MKPTLVQLAAIGFAVLSAYLAFENKGLADDAASSRRTVAMLAQKATTCELAVMAADDWIRPMEPGGPRFSDSDLMGLLRRDFPSAAERCFDAKPSTKR